MILLRRTAAGYFDSSKRSFSQSLGVQSDTVVYVFAEVSQARRENQNVGLFVHEGMLLP